MHYLLISKQSPYVSPPVAKGPSVAKGEKFGYINKKYKFIALVCVLFGAFCKFLSYKAQLCYWSGGFGDVNHHLFSLQSLVGSDSWQMVNLETPANSPRFALFDLVKGKSYRFRVRSVNRFGISEPSAPSPPVTAGPKLGNYCSALHSPRPERD